jgi:hypothetical protein
MSERNVVTVIKLADLEDTIDKMKKILCLAKRIKDYEEPCTCSGNEGCSTSHCRGDSYEPRTCYDEDEIVDGDGTTRAELDAPQPHVKRPECLF